MATNYKMEIKLHNGTDFDTYYPKTSADIVTTSDGKSVEEKLIIQQSTPPTGIVEGRLWLDTSDTSYQGTELENIKSELAQMVTQTVPYAVTTGTANTYAVTLDSAPSSLIEGMAICVKISVANTGASTLNINGLGAKAIKKSNGNDVASGNLKLGGIYTLRYDGLNFILQGEGGEYGNATANDVLSGKTIGTETGLVNGTMDLSNLKAENIKKDVNINGVVGSIIEHTISVDKPAYVISDNVVTVASTTYKKAYSYLIKMKGIIRVRYTLATTDEGTGVYARIYKNNVPIGTERMNYSTGGVTYVEDIIVNVGDVIAIYLKTNNGYAYATINSTSYSITSRVMLGGFTDYADIQIV